MKPFNTKKIPDSLYWALAIIGAIAGAALMFAFWGLEWYQENELEWEYGIFSIVFLIIHLIPFVISVVVGGGIGLFAGGFIAVAIDSLVAKLCETETDSSGKKIILTKPRKIMLIVVVATDNEYSMAQKIFGNKNQIIKTGVGCGNVIKSLKDIPLEEEILNFGYVGSNVIPRGTICTVGECYNYHPNVGIDEPHYTLKGTVTCYTNNDFVLKTDIKDPVIFDMELYIILSLGFKNVTSIKIVSDNLNMEEYNEIF